MSDPRKPNQYEPLKQTKRDVEAKQIAEQQKSVEAERGEQFTERYTAYLIELAEAKKIPGRDIAYNLSRADNDPSFRKDAEAKVAAWEVAKEEIDKGSGKVESAKDAAPVEMTESRAMRLQRLRETTEQIEREQNEGHESGHTHDTGGNSR